MTKRTLMPHQAEALKFLNHRKGCAGLFMDPGTGKTLTTIRYAKALPRTQVIVICRPDDFMTWEDELLMEDYSEYDILMVTSGSQNLPIPPPKWTIITHDLVKNQDIFNWITRCQQYFDLAVVDESHQIKRIEAERTRAVIRATQNIDHRIALTGSPITNEVADVFSQALFIDGGKTFGRSIWPFKNRYYVKDRHGGKWYPRRGAKKEIQQRLKQIAFHVDADDVLSFPGTYYYKVYCPMTGIQRRITEQLVEAWEYESHDGETIEIDYVISQVEKLKQIASGFLYDKGKTRYFRCGKLNQLSADFVDPEMFGNLSKGVVWCSRSAEIKAISRQLKEKGIEHVRFFGEEANKKRLARRDFHDSKHIKYFVGQVESGVGMNELVVANTSIYYSNSRKVVARQQSMRRTKRKGSERHRELNFYDYITEDSIDRLVLRSISKSIDVANYILSALKRQKSLRSILK